MHAHQQKVHLFLITHWVYIVVPQLWNHCKIIVARKGYQAYVFEGITLVKFNKIHYWNTMVCDNYCSFLWMNIKLVWNNALDITLGYDRFENSMWHIYSLKYAIELIIEFYIEFLYFCNYSKSHNYWADQIYA